MNEKSLALLLLLSATGAAAQQMTPDSYAYLGAGYAILDYQDNSFSGNGELDGLLLRGGFQLDENLAVEARFGNGVSDDKVNGVKLELKDFAGGYVKWGAPTRSGLYPYVMVGCTHSRVEIDGDSSSRTDFSYGAGLSYSVNQSISADIDYMKYIDKNGSDMGGVMLGIQFKF